MIVLKQFIVLSLVWGINLYMFLGIFWAIASFFVVNRYASWFVFLTDLVEPPLRLIRKWTKNKLVFGPLDFSLAVLFMALYGLKILLIGLAY